MSFFTRLRNAFSKTNSSNIDIYEIEDSLIEADFGPTLACELAESLQKSTDPKGDLALRIREILTPSCSEIPTKFEQKPTVIMLIGVNGSGKTTTVAKMANMFQNDGLTVDIAACDTFRVAATEQIETWAKRLGCGIFMSDSKREPASLAYEALSKTASDILLIDTAGRLQNNSNLMDELAKISRVLKKIDPKTPHYTYITLDATTGQNSFDQVRAFNEVCDISGIILNKIDGGAKGGIIVRIAKELGHIPIVAVGTGEKITDLQKFSVEKFVSSLL